MMEFKPIIEKENLLFQRKEIEGTLLSEAAPSKVEVTKMLAEKYSSPEDTIIVETIEGRFGSQEFIIVAKIYKSKEILNSTETKTKKQREAEKKAEEDAKKAEEEAKKAEEDAKKAELEKAKEEIPKETPEETPASNEESKETSSEQTKTEEKKE
jgi:ribosomal protein S24E